MEVELLRLELRSLPSDQLADLRGYMTYRGLNRKMSYQLMVLLLQTPAPATDKHLIRQLDAAPGSYRNAKGELENTVLQWRANTSNDWMIPAIRQLTMAHAQMQLGAVDQAYATVQKVQTESEQKGRFALVRMALELKGTLVPHVHPADSSRAMSAVWQEIDEVPRKAEELNRCATLYAHIGRLLDHSMLLRCKKSQQVHAGLQRDLAHLLIVFPDRPSAAWIYRLKSQALLAQFEGNLQAAFHHLHRIWAHIFTHENALHPSEYGYYLFLHAYIPLTLQTRQWPNALETIAIHGASQRHYFAKDKVLCAVQETFQTLAHIGSDNSDTCALSAFRSLIGRIKDGKTEEEADFNLHNWNPHLAANMVLMAVRTAYALGWYDEASKLMGTLKQFKTTNAGPANDLQTIAPLIDLVMTIETAGGTLRVLGTKTFLPNCLSCYDFFRKKTQDYPIEMELARLMRGLAAGSKDHKKLFQRTAHKLAELRTTCPYYKALMLMFDFEAWVNSGAAGRG